jgi:hypothetical protein
MRSWCSTATNPGILSTITSLLHSEIPLKHKNNNKIVQIIWKKLTLILQRKFGASLETPTREKGT